MESVRKEKTPTAGENNIAQHRLLCLQNSNHAKRGKVRTDKAGNKSYTG